MRCACALGDSASSLPFFAANSLMEIDLAQGYKQSFWNSYQAVVPLR